MAAQAIAADLSDGLLACYPLASDAQDASGHGMHGTVMPGIVFTNGCAEFNGTSGYIDLPDGFLTFTNGFSFSGWVRYDSFDELWSRVFDLSAGGQANENIMICHSCTSSNLIYQASNLNIQSAYSFRLGEWHHISLIHNTALELIVFQDGQPMATNFGVNLPNSVQRVDNFLGKSNWSADGFLKGALKEVRFYNRVLTSQEVAELSSVAVLDITSTNATVFGEQEMITLEGTNNTSVIGLIRWTNAATGLSGTSPVSGTQFQIMDIGLAIGPNLITVSGANAFGSEGTDSITITRSLVHGGSSPTH
jgi:hypothetical protein